LFDFYDRPSYDELADVLKKYLSVDEEKEVVSSDDWEEPSEPSLEKKEEAPAKSSKKKVDEDFAKLFNE
jgi:hypothetical protein